MSQTAPEPLLLEREDYSYKAANELTREEIEGYEAHIHRGALSGEDFVRFISVPLRKKSALELGLSERKAQGCFLKRLSVEELMEEKNRVKNELKYYDKLFIKKVGKPPSNREKEPLKWADQADLPLLQEPGPPDFEALGPNQEAADQAEQAEAARVAAGGLPGAQGRHQAHPGEVPVGLRGAPQPQNQVQERHRARGRGVRALHQAQEGNRGARGRHRKGPAQPGLAP